MCFLVCYSFEFFFFFVCVCVPENLLVKIYIRLHKQMQKHTILGQ